MFVVKMFANKTMNKYLQKFSPDTQFFSCNKYYIS